MLVSDGDYLVALNADRVLVKFLAPFTEECRCCGLTYLRDVIWIGGFSAN